MALTVHSDTNSHLTINPEKSNTRIFGKNFKNPYFWVKENFLEKLGSEKFWIPQLSTITQKIWKN